MNRTDEFIVLWFPPDADRERKFKTEEAARNFIDTHEDKNARMVKDWNPILTIRTTIVNETEIPL